VPLTPILRLGILTFIRADLRRGAVLRCGSRGKLPPTSPDREALPGPVLLATPGNHRVLPADQEAVQALHGVLYEVMWKPSARYFAMLRASVSVQILVHIRYY
jgi:hypothetical protein